jgi:hypothetical protein
MTMKVMRVIMAVLSVGLLLSATAIAQPKTGLMPDLAALAQRKDVTVNRAVTLLAEDGKKGIRVDQRPNEGLVWLPDISLTNGTISFDMRGKDILQQSFVGIAFHGLDDKTYEAIYFRPFNFRSDDADRRSHAVQYVAQPIYTWQKLRADFPNTYEAAIDSAPDPNDWFHVRIEINSPTVRVFINGKTSPILEVKQLAKQTGNKLGLWVGNNSGGDFANLIIKPVQN